MKKSIIVLIIIAVLVVIGAVWAFGTNRAVAPENGVVQNGQVDTSDWETYRNEELGFEFKIPREFLSEDFGQTNITGLDFGTKLKNYVYTDKGDGRGLFRVIKGDVSPDLGHGTPGFKIEEKSVLVGGISAIKSIYEGKGDEGIGFWPLTREIIYEFRKDGHYYHIRFTSAVENKKLWNKFEQTVLSFKFL